MKGEQAVNEILVAVITTTDHGERGKLSDTIRDLVKVMVPGYEGEFEDEIWSISDTICKLIEKQQVKVKQNYTCKMTSTDEIKFIAELESPMVGGTLTVLLGNTPFPTIFKIERIEGNTLWVEAEDGQ